MLQMAANAVFRPLDSRVLDTGAAIEPLAEEMVNLASLVDARALKNVLEIVGSPRYFLVTMDLGYWLWPRLH